ncbi:MAG: hypothetical protein HXY43_21925 [Fischerella sp.]|uniref:hypothetical protein n=1 Tax=Fischerella sp. TaxID=1191 RepID=UPI0018365AFF|nr:hypothetical protein [Fischerella sp.]NWF61841.1 hypothetical protein [Fischerella sp.]
MKPSVYRHAVAATACLGLLLLPVGCYEVKVSFESESTQPNTSSSQSDSNTQSESAIASTVSTPTPTKSLFTYHDGSAVKGVGQGSLRMSNQTEQPVRLALLVRRAVVKSTSGQNQPVSAHWDFAPGEGSEKGLILSLPNSNVKLEKGDILVAFAQDGSRRYWGPYVVGETPAPVWNPQKKEWELILSQ